jgi:hypothetical protein
MNTNWIAGAIVGLAVLVLITLWFLEPSPNSGCVNYPYYC